MNGKLRFLCLDLRDLTPLANSCKGWGRQVLPFGSRTFLLAAFFLFGRHIPVCAQEAGQTSAVTLSNLSRDHVEIRIFRGSEGARNERVPASTTRVIQVPKGLFTVFGRFGTVNDVDTTEDSIWMFSKEESPTAGDAPVLTFGRIPMWGFRDWTSGDGRSIRATMLYVEGGNVTFQRGDGTVFAVPVGKLSADSQAVVMSENAGGGDLAKRASKLGEAFLLVGRWLNLQQDPKTTLNDPAAIKIMNETIVNEALFTAWPKAVSRFGKEVANVRYLTLEIEKKPSFVEVRRILGSPDSVETEKGVTWCIYGWAHFGVANGMVVRLRGDCRASTEPKARTAPSAGSEPGA